MLQVAGIGTIITASLLLDDWLSRTRWSFRDKPVGCTVAVIIGAAGQTVSSVVFYFKVRSSSLEKGMIEWIYGKLNCDLISGEFEANVDLHPSGFDPVVHY